MPQAESSHTFIIHGFGGRCNQFKHSVDDLEFQANSFSVSFFIFKKINLHEF